LTWQDASKAVYILGAIAALDQGVGMDARLAEIEAKLAAVRPNGGARPNGSAGCPEARL
jgi:hypothetical protein